MSDKLHLPGGGQGLIAPGAAIAANEARKRTIVPCLFTTGRPPLLLEPKSVVPVRNYHRTMHVMAKGDDKPLCRCNPPDGYPELHSLSQDENATVMTADKHAPQWHRLFWCGACTTWAGLLVRKTA